MIPPPPWLSALILVACIPFMGGILWLIYGSRWGIYAPPKKSEPKPEPKIDVAPVKTKPAPVIVFGSNEDGQFGISWSDGSDSRMATFLPFNFTRTQSRALANEILRYQDVDSEEAALIKDLRRQAEEWKALSDNISAPIPDAIYSGDDPAPPGADDSRRRASEFITAVFITSPGSVFMLVHEGVIPWELARAIHWNVTHEDLGAEEPDWALLFSDDEDEDGEPKRGSAMPKEPLVTPYNGPANDGSKS